MKLLNAGYLNISRNVKFLNVDFSSVSFHFRLSGFDHCKAVSCGSHVQINSFLDLWTIFLAVHLFISNSLSNYFKINNATHVIVGQGCIYYMYWMLRSRLYVHYVCTCIICNTSIIVDVSNRPNHMYIQGVCKLNVFLMHS